MLHLLNLDGGSKKNTEAYDGENASITIQNRNISSVDLTHANKTNINFFKLPIVPRKKETLNDIQNKSLDNINVKSDGEVNNLEDSDNEAVVNQPKM